MSFNFDQLTAWRPFFSKNYPNPGLASIQVYKEIQTKITEKYKIVPKFSQLDALTYVETTRESLLELQEKIERSIREKFITWRPRMITRWNRYVSATLRELLQT